MLLSFEILSHFLVLIASISHSLTFFQLLLAFPPLAYLARIFMWMDVVRADNTTGWVNVLHLMPRACRILKVHPNMIVFMALFSYLGQISYCYIFYSSQSKFQFFSHTGEWVFRFGLKKTT